MKGYTSRQEIENYLLLTIDPSFYAQVTEWIGQVEKYIDKVTNRNFVADTVATTKKYDGDGTNTLLIDDAVLVTKVETGSDADGWDEIDQVDVYYYPVNSTPKIKVVIEGIFPSYYQSVRITGKWGYSVAAPDDIAFAATVLTAGIINFSNQSEGEVQSKTIGSYTITYKTDRQWRDFDRVDEILKYYKKYHF